MRRGKSKHLRQETSPERRRDWGVKRFLLSDIYNPKTQNIFVLNSTTSGVRSSRGLLSRGWLWLPTCNTHDAAISPRVEARLRGITAWWFCRKKGHLHTIPCNEQEWDNELAYNRHFTQRTYNSCIIQSTHIVRLRTKPKEKKITQLLDPRSSQLGSTTDQQETKHSNDQGLRWSPIWARLHHLH